MSGLIEEFNFCTPFVRLLYAFCTTFWIFFLFKMFTTRVNSFIKFLRLHFNFLVFILYPGKPKAFYSECLPFLWHFNREVGPKVSFPGMTTGLIHLVLKRSFVPRLICLLICVRWSGFFKCDELASHF